MRVVAYFFTARCFSQVFPRSIVFFADFPRGGKRSTPLIFFLNEISFQMKGFFGSFSSMGYNGDKYVLRPPLTGVGLGRFLVSLP